MAVALNIRSAAFLHKPEVLNVDTPKTINHLSLCTGYEGIGMGLRNIWPNVREIAYVEIEAFAIANLVGKMEKGLLHPAPIYSDLKTFPYGEFRDRVSFLSAGFPCQPFSLAGVSKYNSLGWEHGFNHEVKGTFFFDNSNRYLPSWCI